MFSTLKERLMLGVYIFILLSIPVGTYLVSQNQTYKSQAKEQKSAKPKVVVPPKPTTSPAKQLLDSSQKTAGIAVEVTPTPSSSPSSSSPEIATSFGPTLSFKITLEGKPKGSYGTKLFVGISEENLTTNPKFLLTFMVDLPASGEYSNLSLAGLTPGSRYTALLKGSAQIATSSAFTMSPVVTNLNEGEVINLLSGDLNDDNVVNSADHSIAQKAFGSTSNSANWNENADFNLDGVINAFDLIIITKNMGQVGASGAWTSPLPKVATPSASLTSPPVGGPAMPDGSKGYWIWIPSR